MRVVSNTSPLCNLAIIGRLGLLKRRHGSVAIPKAVSDELAITLRHAERAGNLDWTHRDPFDRLLAAQAELEKLTLVTLDSAFNNSTATTLWDDDR